MINKTHLYALADALKMALHIEVNGICGKAEVTVEGTPLKCIIEVVASHHDEKESGIICRVHGGHLYLWMRYISNNSMIALHLLDGTKMKCQPNRLTVKPTATSLSLREFFKGSCAKTYMRSRAGSVWQDVTKTVDML